MRKVVRHGYRVELRRRGPKEFLRWVLRDTALRYWTGESWSDDPAKASVYASEPAAIVDAATLECKRPPRKLFAMLKVMVDAPGDFTPEQLRDYLERNFQWRLKSDHGGSDLDTARIDFEFEWNGIQEDD